MSTMPGKINLQRYNRREYDISNDAEPLDGSYDAFVATISALLGILFGSSLLMGYLNLAVFPQLWIFIAALSLFHYLEFIITALYNTDKLSIDSFLLNNGSHYIFAQLTAVAEALIRYYVFRSTPQLSVSVLGLLLLLPSQFIRSFAMISAGHSFSHTVAKVKQKTHVLVTSGIYQYSRHPSYSGYFYWALSSQLLLGNYVTFVIFSVVLWKFFSQRIIVEEAYLVSFFGTDYLLYRKKVGTLIPFIQ